MHRAIPVSILLLLLAGISGFGLASRARDFGRPDAIDTVRLAELPPEAVQTLHLIRQGGPFPYPHRDGRPFGNFEKRLPIKPRAYYREYTVPTPGRRDRGARRIVAGQDEAREYYYSDDHYDSFRRILDP